MTRANREACLIKRKMVPFFARLYYIIQTYTCEFHNIVTSLDLLTAPGRLCIITCMHCSDPIRHSGLFDLNLAILFTTRKTKNIYNLIAVDDGP